MKCMIMMCAVNVMSAHVAMAQAKPGDAGEFEGKWAVAFPEDAGVLVNTPDATCDDPVVIEAIGPNVIRYRSPKGADVTFEVMEFAGRNPWWSNTGNMVAEWHEFEAFLLAPVGTTGKADWTRAKEYLPCSSDGSF